MPGRFSGDHGWPVLGCSPRIESLAGRIRGDEKSNFTIPNRSFDILTTDAPPFSIEKQTGFIGTRIEPDAFAGHACGETFRYPKSSVVVLAEDDAAKFQPAFFKEEMKDCL
jgi:hypothetical protein